MKLNFETPNDNRLEIEIPAEDESHPLGMNNPAIKKYTFVPKLLEAANNQTQTVSYDSFKLILSNAKRAMEKQQNEPKSTSSSFCYSIFSSWYTVISDLTFLNRIHQKLKDYDQLKTAMENSLPKPAMAGYC